MMTFLSVCLCALMRDFAFDQNHIVIFSFVILASFATYFSFSSMTSPMHGVAAFKENRI